MHDFQKFVKSTGVYLVGNVLTKLVQFMMLPLYTKYINPDDYGTFDLHIAYISFFSSILFLDIWGGIMRFMFDYKQDEKAKPVVNGLVILAGSTILYTISFFFIGSIMQLPFIGWMYLYGLSMNYAQVIGYIARALGKNYVYVIGGFVGTLVNVGSNIVFIAFLNKGYEYLYISYVMGMLTNIIIIAASVKFPRLLRIKYFDTGLLKEMFRFAVPLSLNSAAFWFLTSYNKLVISEKLSTVENGLYAVACKFSAMVQLVTQCFQMAWQELTFSKAGSSKAEMDEFYTKTVNAYIGFMGMGTIMLIPFIKLIFPIIIDPAYKDAEGLIPIALLGTLFSCIGTFVASIISTIKKNTFLFTTTLTGSIINVCFIHLLIPFCGMYAAVISFAVGYFVVVIRRIQLVRKYISIRLNWKLVGGTFGLFWLAYVIFVFGKYYINGIFLLGLVLLFLYMYHGKIAEIGNKLRGR